MIRVDKDERFPLTVAVIDENTGSMAVGKTVYYDVRTHPDDSSLTPTMSGVLEESVVEPGVYSTTLFFSESGQYVAYTSCSGFTSGAEDIIVEEDNLVDLVKQNRYYNISVEDVVRENAIPTVSQTTRKVAMGNTDYVINAIKWDAEPDWNHTTISGVIYAWYKNLDDDVPYKMAGPV